jgi:hypothetical protein
LKTLFHRFDFLIGILFVLFVAWWVWRHVRNARTHKAKASPSPSENAEV